MHHTWTYTMRPYVGKCINNIKGKYEKVFGLWKTSGPVFRSFLTGEYPSCHWPGIKHFNYILQILFMVLTCFTRIWWAWTPMPEWHLPSYWIQRSTRRGCRWPKRTERSTQSFPPIAGPFSWWQVVILLCGSSF